MKNSNLLTISQFSRITGISRKNLIYYDSIGLLEPDHYGENGYRYYAIKQIELSYIILTLKTLNLPLTSIKKYLSIRTPKLGLDLFRQQLEKVNDEIYYLEEIKEYLDFRIRITEECFSVTFGTPSIHESPQELFYINDTTVPNEAVYDSDSITEFYDKLISVNAFINYNFGLIYESSNKNDPFSDNDYSCKFTLRSTSFSNVHPQIIKEKGTYLVSYHLGSITSFDEAILISSDYAKKHNIILSDKAYYDVLWDEVVSKDNNHQICKLAVQVIGYISPNQ